MITALLDGRLATVQQSAADRAHCPGCGGEVYAKRGDMAVYHWAHMPGAQCSYEAGETDWHREWKMAFVGVGQIEHVKGNHRADVWTPIRGSSNPGRAFEFQSKPLDLGSMADRAHHWGNVVWILDARNSGVEYLGMRDGIFTGWSWRNCPQMIWKGVNPWAGVGGEIYADLGDMMLRITDEPRSEFGKGRDGGMLVWGQAEHRQAWIDRFRADAEPRVAPRSYIPAAPEAGTADFYREALDRSQRNYEAMMERRRGA